MGQSVLQALAARPRGTLGLGRLACTPPSHMDRHPPRTLLLLLTTSMLAAATMSCAPAPRAASAANGPNQTIVLFGEVHDNAAQHALRIESLKAMIRAGRRPAVLMEPFDRERQADIDRARAGAQPPSADALIAAGGGDPSGRSGGWNWALYRPVIELALANDLPIVAANVSRPDTRRVIADGLAAHGFDPRVPPDILDAQAREIEQTHCGQIDAALAQRMALAQVARDQFMAQQVETHAARGVLLVAGNGHVRNDIGVPRWLRPETRRASEAIGMLEEGDDDAGAFDRTIITPRQPRADPCNAMR
jgi:uncharacterized iron-regulated protein